MEQLPVYAYIHPIWQAVALMFGIYLAAVALPNVDRPSFRVRTHERLSRLFMVMVLAGAVFGKIVSAMLPAGTARVQGHTFLSVLIVILLTVGSIFGYQGGRLRLRRKTGMMQAHPWLIVIVIALMFAQGVLGIGAKGLKLIKF